MPRPFCTTAFRDISRFIQVGDLPGLGVTGVGEIEKQHKTRLRSLSPWLREEYIYGGVRPSVANQKNPSLSDGPIKVSKKINVWRVLYGLTVLVMLWALSGTYLPRVGFTNLLDIGEYFDKGQVSALANVDYYTEDKTYGYDGQHYAKVAVDPWLKDPGGLEREVDNVFYRSRRIFLGWSAWLLGFGNPAWVLQIYSIQNAICWLILSWFLTCWFPPTGLNNFVRWFGVMASCGLVISVRYSLTDGPSLLFIALAVRAYEKERNFLGDVAMTVAGLTRDSNLVGLTVLFDPKKRNLRSLLMVAVRTILIIAPLAAWILYVRYRIGHDIPAGFDNFKMPLTAYGRKWIDVMAEVWVHRTWESNSLQGLCVATSILVQALFLIFRPTWSQPWWRIGIGFVCLMALLGDAVWEGYPGAAPRVLLPMVLAFNVLVPRTRKAWPILILGNLSIISAPALMMPPLPQMVVFHGPRTYKLSPERNRVAVEFDRGWEGVERNLRHAWQWASGPAEIIVVNPHKQPLLADMTLTLSAGLTRPLAIKFGEKELWHGQIFPHHDKLELKGIRLEPGENKIVFVTAPGTFPANGDKRPMAFQLQDLQIDLLGFKIK